MESQDKIKPGPVRPRVAYQGEPGAFSEKAVRRYFSDIAETIPCFAFSDVFDAVVSDRADFGMIPIENTLAGNVHPNYDLLLEYDVQIVGEVKLRIVHNLIAHTGMRLEDIRVVYTHPQAAMQCDQFLRSRPQWRVQLSYDTAGSVKYIKDQGIREGAAIASKEAAEKFGMEIIKEGVETSPLNYTRFIVIARQAPAGREADKISILFNTRNEPGALARVLNMLAEQGINLTKLESRPLAGKPWEYMFYADFEGDGRDPRTQAIINEMKSAATFFKMLGSYKSCPDPTGSS